MSFTQKTWKEWREGIEHRLHSAGFENPDEATIVSIDMMAWDLEDDEAVTKRNGDGSVDLWEDREHVLV